jgi:hypothetical protein
MEAATPVAALRVDRTFLMAVTPWAPPVRIKNKMVVPMATQKVDEASSMAVNVAMTPLEC